MGTSLKEFIKEEVPDWDDDVVSAARFKAFSGQRSDWETKYWFWRDLIIKVARHLGVTVIHASEAIEEPKISLSLALSCTRAIIDVFVFVVLFNNRLKLSLVQLRKSWFVRNGLTPLCIDRVLLEMYNDGDILRIGDLKNPSGGTLYGLFKRALNLVGARRSAEIFEEQLILSILVKLEFITMERCCLHGQSQGMKLSLLPQPVPTATRLDYDTLHLVWTLERLQQQLDVINNRYRKSKEAAIASLKCGNRQDAQRHVRHLKLATDSRNKCISLLNRVEEVLGVIADAEATKKATEAIQIGARAIRENGISVEEVHLCLQELSESIDSQKQAEEMLASSPYPILDVDMDDEEMEEEFKKLEAELGEDVRPAQMDEAVSARVQHAKNEELVDSLGNALSRVTLEPA